MEELNLNKPKKRVKEKQLLLGTCGYIAYDKFIKEEPKAKEENISAEGNTSKLLGKEEALKLGKKNICIQGMAYTSVDINR